MRETIVDPEQLYKKEGRKYVPVGWEFTGWPSNGIWIVEDSKQSLMRKVKDVQATPDVLLVDYLTHQDALLTHFLDLIDKSPEKKGVSIRDLAEEACVYFAEMAMKKYREDIFEF